VATSGVLHFEIVVNRSAVNAERFGRFLNGGSRLVGLDQVSDLIEVVAWWNMHGGSGRALGRTGWGDL
jgi:hypothetical protein